MFKPNNNIVASKLYKADLSLNTALKVSILSCFMCVLVACGGGDDNSGSSTPNTPSTSPNKPQSIVTYQDNFGSIKSTQSKLNKTDDATPTFNVQKNLNSVKLFVDNKVVDSTYNAQLGELVPIAPIAIGEHGFAYSFINDKNIESPKSDSFTITIVQPAAKPSLITSYQDNVGRVQNNASTHASTDDNTPTLNIAKDLTGVSLYIDDEKVDSEYDSTQGTLVAKKPATIGKHEYRYSTSDAVIGESPKSEAFTISIIDASNTPAPLQSYQDNTGSIQNLVSSEPRTDDPTPKFNITKNLDNVKLYIDGKVVAAKYNPTAGTLVANEPASIGKHEYTYSYKDAIKGVSFQSQPLTITIVERAKKPAPIHSYQDNVGNIQNKVSSADTTDDATPTFNISKKLNDVTLYVDGQSTASNYDKNSGTLVASAAVNAGRHQFSYTINDSVTGESPLSDALVINIIGATNVPEPLQNYQDNTGSIQSTSSTARKTDDPTPKFNISKNLESVKLYIDGVVVKSRYNPTEGTLIAKPAATVGTHTYTYSYKDAVKGVSTQSDGFKLTIVEPASKPSAFLSYQDNVGNIQNIESNAAITDDTTPTFNVAKNLTGAKLYIDGQLINANYDANSGTLVATSAATLGTHQYNYTTYDAVTGESPKSDSLTVSIVASATKPASILSYQDNVGEVQSDNSVAAITDDDTIALNITKNLAEVKLYIDGNSVDSNYNASTGTLLVTKPVAVGVHAYSYSVVDAVTGESPHSDEFIVKLDTSADLDNKIETISQIADDPSVPLTTAEEFENSIWGSKTAEEVFKERRLKQQQELALFAVDPDPEWISSSASEPLTIVKPGLNYSVQFYKNDNLNNKIGAVDPELLRLELRIQTTDKDIQYIPAEYHAKYVNWDVSKPGQLNVNIPATLTEGMLIVGIRPKTEDPAQRALTERWSTVTTFEVWNAKPEVNSLTQAQVVFPKTNLNNEIAVNSAFTVKEIRKATRLHLSELALPIPLVVYGNNYKEGDLIDYIVGQRPHSGRVHKVVASKKGQQLLILVPELLNVYDIILNQDTNYADMGVSPEFKVYRDGDKIEDPNSDEPTSPNYIGPSDRSTIQAKPVPPFTKECTGSVASMPTVTFSFDHDIISNNPKIGVSSTVAINNFSGKVECKVAINSSKFKVDIDAPGIGKLLKKLIGMGIVVSPHGEIKASLSAKGGESMGFSTTLGYEASVSDSNPILDFNILGANSTGYGLKQTPLGLDASLGAEIGVKAELKLVDVSEDSETVGGWLIRLLTVGSDSPSLDFKFSAVAAPVLAGKITNLNAAYVYKNSESSKATADFYAKWQFSASTGITKIISYLGLKINLDFVKTTDKVNLFKREAKFKADNVEDNGRGVASADIELVGGGKLFGMSATGYASLSDEESSVFNDFSLAMMYDVEECKAKGGKINTPFVGCSGNMFCGQVSGTAELCQTRKVSVTPINGGGMEGKTISSSTTVNLSGDYNSTAKPNVKYSVSVGASPLSLNKSTAQLTLNGSETIKASGVCPSIGAHPTTVTASFEDSVDTKEGAITCTCNPNVRDCDRIWGDPYLLTADGLAYDYLASGDYILQRIVDENNQPIHGLEVQGRFLPGYDVSWVHGAAVQVGNDVVEITPAILGHGNSSIGMEIKVNGQYIYRPAVDGVGGSYEGLLETRLIELPDGGKILIDSFVQQFFTYKPAKVTILWPNPGKFEGFALTLSVPDGQFTDPEPFIDFQFVRPDTYAGFERGLMGNNDGDPENDLMRRNGDFISTKNMTDRTQFYSLFGGDWLPRGQECLFSDGCQQPDFPTKDIVLTAEQRALGEYACSNLTGFYKEACIHDVGLTGNVDLVIDAYSNTEDLNEMAGRINTLTLDSGLQAGIYTSKWLRSAIVDQAFNVKAVVNHVQGDGKYQIVAVPPEGATVEIDGESFVSGILSNKASRTHTITVDCKNPDPIFEDFRLGHYGHVQLWNVNPDTGYTDVLLDESRLSCDTSQRMAAGLHHNLVLDNDGKLWSWGRNDKGQLGTGGTSSGVNYVPARVKISDDIAKRITFIASGDNHNIALDNNAKLWAWGDNTYGQLGNGSNDYKDPVLVDMSAINTTDNKIVSVQAGGAHSLALYDNGDVWGWGRSNRGQLGNGNRINMTTPTKIDLTVIDTPVIQIAAGNSHTLVLDAQGEVWAWGDNTYGQIGNPAETTDFVTSPVKVNLEELSGSQVIGIASGLNHNLILDELGRLWAWGDNRQHQLGNEQFTASISNTPILVDKIDIGNRTEILSISAGGNHNAIFDEYGKVWTWGNNDAGQLGVTDYADKAKPTLMQLQISDEADVASIVLGLDSTFILDSKGYLFSAGNESSTARNLDLTYSSGNYYSVDRSNIPKVFTKLDGEPEYHDFSIAPATSASSVLGSRVHLGSVNGRMIMPLGKSTTINVADNLYAGYRKFTSIEMDRTSSIRFQTASTCNKYGEHTLSYHLEDGNGDALTTTTELDFICYPDIQTRWKVDQDSGNVYLVIKNNSVIDTPVKLKVNDNELIMALVAQQTTTHIFDSLNCNATAQTDQNHTMNIDSLSNNQAYYSQQAIFYPSSSCGNGLIDAGYSHSMIASSKGQLWTWGSNHNGQLGYSNSYRYNSSKPYKVNMNNIELGAITDFSTGNQHNIALDGKTNTLWAWGENTYGQLGNGNSGHSGNSYQTVPAKVDLTNLQDSKLSSVSAGYYHNLALDTDGKIWAWGANFHGELGINSIENQVIPVAVDISSITQTNAKVTKVSTGFYHSVALDDKGQVWAWGYNHLGQLGIPDVTNLLAPTLVDVSAVTATGATVINVSAGNFHNLVLDSNGKLWTWGSNQNGQLGNNQTVDSIQLIQVDLSNLPVDDNIKMIDAGGNHNLILLNSGKMLAWGNNDNGVLGIGDSAQSLIPTRLNQSNIGGAKILNIATDAGHSLALDNYGQLWAWGSNRYGQLGTSSQSSIPVKVYTKDIDDDNQSN